MVEYFVALAITLMLIICFLVARIKVGGPTGLITKTLATLGIFIFAFATMFEKGFSETAAFISIGLIFGMIGDILLDLKVMHENESSYYLNGGILAFSFGHFLYLAGIISFVGTGGLNRPALLSIGLFSACIALIVSSLIIFLISPKMKIKFGKFLYQSFAYCVLLVFMAVFSILLAIVFPKLWFAAIGLMMFFISDLILSMQYFGGKQNSKLLTVLNHSSYYIAQLLIMSFLYFI